MEPEGDQIQPAAHAQTETPAAHWSLATRIAFRFCFAYFVLFSLSNQIFSVLFLIPGVDIPEFSGLWPLRQITFWTAAHVFHVTRTLV
jgi:hypothetical protein